MLGRPFVQPVSESGTLANLVIYDCIQEKGGKEKLTNVSRFRSLSRNPIDFFKFALI